MSWPGERNPCVSFSEQPPHARSRRRIHAVHAGRQKIAHEAHQLAPSALLCPYHFEQVDCFGQLELHVLDGEQRELLFTSALLQEYQTLMC